MQDLTLVGMHDDGERLLLSNSGGERFTLAVDEALRAAVRGDRPRLGQIQLETERMRPKDIQTRIRAGQTAEEVASAGEVPIEYVRRYEGPVLAERAYVATQARKVQIRRGALAAAITPTLGELVDERLRRREVDPEATSWDAWRADDGSWTVVMSFPVGSKQRQARWNYNPPLRQVTPLDDESRWLTDGDGRDARGGRGQRKESEQAKPDGQGRRLAVAPAPSGRGSADRTGGAADTDPIDELPEERDLLDALVETDQPYMPSLELLDSLRERRGRRVRPIDPDEPDDGEPDPVESAIESILAMRSPAAPGAPAGTSGGPAPGAPSRRTTPRAPRNGSMHPAGKALPRKEETRGTSAAKPTASTPGGSAPRGSAPTGTAPDARSGDSSPESADDQPSARRGPSRPARRTPQRTVEVPVLGSSAAELDADEAEREVLLDLRESASEDAQEQISADSAAQSAAPAGRQAKGTPARKNRRASVPSWDEIILGGRRD